MIKVDTIIPFCSYDEKFINDTINGVRNISSKIIVTYFDFTFDGLPENQNLINSLKESNRDCIFVKLDYNKNNSSRWHHNYTRWIGSQIATSEYILYLDADEVFESNKITSWFKNQKSLKDVTTFANYWYFRSKRYRANTIEDSPVMINKSLVVKDRIFHDLERAAFKYYGFDLELGVMGDDNTPMCHHYSWVLSKDEMLRKTKSWGHRSDKNWEKLIEEEFSREFNGTDFIHNYIYTILED
jgi:hypothetical protein